MDGILSQDEIQALLSGMDLSDSTDSTDNTDEGTSQILEVDESLLNDSEKDAIGEIANISMGSSATTLFSLVNRRVNITTPVVTLANWNSVIEEYQKPCVFIQIRYMSGLDGSNIMVLKEHDVKVITDLMMGGDGSNIDGELSELHLSAISEAMNQMMGAAATSMSTMLGRMIDISPPEASRIDLQEITDGENIADFLSGTFVKIAFRMQIDELVDSTIMQLYPIDFARSLYDIFMSSQISETEPEPKPEPVSEPKPQPYVPPAATVPQPDMSQMGSGIPQPDMSQMGMNMGMQGMPQMNMAPMGMMNMQMPQMNIGYAPGAMPQVNTTIQPAQFQSFNSGGNVMAGQENIGLIMDVPLEVTVELGRTKKSIAEILDFAPGTIIELEKIAGEPIDVLVNGKFVAKGEVVVIEESFGIRVTEIIK